MIGWLWIVTTFLTRIALYQGIQAMIVRPPSPDELGEIRGQLHRVDTPVPRNKNAPYAELMVEVSPARFARPQVRAETMSADALARHVGKDVAIKFAARRPRNRWVYELVADRQTVIALSDEIARDERAKASALLGMAWAGGAAALVFGFTVRRMRRSGVSPKA